MMKSHIDDFTKSVNFSLYAYSMKFVLFIIFFTFLTLTVEAQPKYTSDRREALRRKKMMDSRESQEPTTVFPITLLLLAGGVGLTYLFINNKTRVSNAVSTGKTVVLGCFGFILIVVLFGLVSLILMEIWPPLSLLSIGAFIYFMIIKEWD